MSTMAVDLFASERTSKNPAFASSTFADLPTDFLWSVFKRLDFSDVLRARCVCSSWNSLGKELFPNTPWLILPSREEVETEHDTEANNNAYSGFLKLGENEAYIMKKIPKEFRECCCIGSSNGWLVFLGEKAVPFLFHPFKQVKTELPSICSLLGLSRFERAAEGHFELVDCNNEEYSLVYNKQSLRCFHTGKTILTAEPDCNNGNYSVVLLYDKDGKLAYYKNGDNCWTEVPGSKNHTYHDIICHENHLFALHRGAGFAIWNCEGDHFTPITTCDPKFPLAISSGGNLFTPKFYLVESCGDILLVVRFVGEFVNRGGKLVREGYRTYLFHVYNFDFYQSNLYFCEPRWVKMDSLGDRALFLGGNESVAVSTRSFPNCKPDSIYYTDDYWRRMEEDSSYGGHDMGVYDLKEGTVEPIYDYFSEKILPPPCWIIPTAL